MEIEQAIHLTKQINQMLDRYNYQDKKILIYKIKHYNYIDNKINIANYINIALKDLKNNNFKYEDINRIINSYNGKRRRIKKRIKKMKSNNIWFATYTIEDKYINKNHTRKLKELLKENNYIINSDYGKTTNRLHYHAIIESEEKPKQWDYGFCKFIKVRNINETAIAKYITKITNHTIKKTTDKIIYSR